MAHLDNLSILKPTMSYNVTHHWSKIHHFHSLGIMENMHTKGKKS
jgi:hypothetical protein